MTQDNKIFSLDEKVRLVARDIYDTALLKNSLKLEHFVPSKQVQNLLDEDEFVSIIAFLKNKDILTFTFRDISIATRGKKLSKSDFPTYKMVINQPGIRRLLGLKDTAAKPVEKGAKLHPEYSYLIINGVEIPLAKGKLQKSLQYWICRFCLKKPNIPVQETDIMAKYAPDFEITGRGRAVRDAVYKLNPKIKVKTGIDELFTFSNGYVVFNENKLK